MRPLLMRLLGLFHRRQLDDELSDEMSAHLELFTADCRYTVVSRENQSGGMALAAMRCESRAMLADRVHAVRELQVYRPRVNRHLIGPIRVLDGDDERWIVRANYAVFESVAGATLAADAIRRSADHGAVPVRQAIYTGEAHPVGADHI